LTMDPKDDKWCPYPDRTRGGFRPWPFYGRRPPRHWFFFRILMAFFWICMALIFIPFFNGEGPTFQKFIHHLPWVALVMFAGFMLLRRIFRPLRMLTHGVNEIASGNLDFQFQTQGRHGEIYFLAENFNFMIQRVREMIQSKDQLLLDVSHELRSPLTRMKVALEMMPKNKLRAGALQDIAEMEKMLSEILETQRLKGENGKLVLKPLDLTALARAVARKYKLRKPGVALIGKPSPITLQADPGRVETVLRNVLENALKYSSRQKKPVQVSLEEKEGTVVVAVRDFGPGIPLEDREKVFEPFYRIDKSRAKETGGYGLGLSLCRVIMRAHGGEIRLDDGVEKGTRMLLEFPKTAPPLQ